MAMTPEEMESAIKELTEKNEGLTKQVGGTEELLQRHKTEIGDARKEIKAAMESVDPEKMKKVLDNIDKMEENLNSSSSSREGTPPEEEPADVRKQMNEEQRKVADDKFVQLPPADRIEIKGDPEKMKAFLNAAMEAAPAVPESLFDDAAQASTPPVNEYRKLFNLADQESSFVPGGARTDSGGYKGATRKGQVSDEPTEKRLPGGIIPRPPTE